MGGYSSERDISLASGMFVLDALAQTDNELIALDIAPASADHAQGIHDYWRAHDMKDRELEVDWTQMTVDGGRPDVVINMVHGTPGEDGWLSHHLDQLGIPHTSCRGEAADITFDKVRNNQLAAELGAVIPRGVYLPQQVDIDTARAEAAHLQLPCFIKPSQSGSSYGVSRITDWGALEEALNYAASEDGHIMIEEGIEGVELACGVAKLNDEIRILGVTEIVPEGDFFDYESKYEGGSQEITPARISDVATQAIHELTTQLYDGMNLKGLCRADYFLTPDNQVVLIEINSVPGMSPESIVPKQVDALNMPMAEFLNLLIQQAINDG